MLVGQQHRAAQQAAMHRQTLQQLRIDTLAAQKQVILPPRPSRAYITSRVAKIDKPWYSEAWDWYAGTWGSIYSPTTLKNAYIDPYTKMLKTGFEIGRNNTPEAMSDYINSAFVYSLMVYSEGQSRSNNHYERSTQNPFSESTARISNMLLQEFALGEGPEHRYFTEDQQITREFLNGYVLDDSINGLYKKAREEKMTYAKFRAIKKSISYGLAFSPDQTDTLDESKKRHISANPIQLVIGGAMIYALPSKKDSSYADIEIINAMSRPSVMLHTAKDTYLRSSGVRQLSTIYQHFTFSVKIDPNKFPKK